MSNEGQAVLLALNVSVLYMLYKFETSINRRITKRRYERLYVVKLPYGLRQEGESERLVHISEIIPSESGLRCRCVCPSCGVRLQAKLPI